MGHALTHVLCIQQKDFCSLEARGKINICIDTHNILSGVIIENYYFQQFMAHFFKIKISVVVPKDNFTAASTENNMSLVS